MIRWIRRIIAAAALMAVFAATLQAQDATDQALIDAVFANDAEAVRQQLAGGADPDAVGKTGHNVLTVAAIRGYAQVTQLLLDGGADVDAFAHSGTPILYCSAQPQPQTIALLIAAGANVNETSRTGLTAVHAATFKNLPQQLEQLLSAGALCDPRNDKEQTPLMMAAAGGYSACVTLLLDAGADPKTQDAAGKTPLDLARDGGHQAVAQQIQDHLHQSGAIVAAGPVAHVGPGEDLAAAIGRAADGATLQLKAGEYRGGVILRGKRLTLLGDPAGGTVIAGHAGQPSIVVAAIEKAHLQMRQIDLRSIDAKQMPLFIQGAHARLERCRAVNIPGDGVYVEGGQLVLHDCAFTGIGRVGLLLLKNSSAQITASQFNDIKQTAIHTQDQSTVDVSASSFRNIGQTAVLGIRAGSVSVRASQFEAVSSGAVVAQQAQRCLAVANTITNCGRGIDSRQISGEAIVRQNVIEAADPKADGVALADVAHAAVTGNAIFGARQGIILTGASQGPPAVARNTIVRPRTGGMYIELSTKEAAVAARLTRNRIIAPAEFGILLTGDGRSLLVNNAVIGGEKAMAVSLQDKATALLRENVLAGGKASLNFYKASAAASSVRKELLRGAVLGDGQRPADGEMHRRLAVVMEQPDRSAAFDAASAAALEVAANAKATELKTLDLAIEQLQQQISAAYEASKQLGSVTLAVEDVTGRQVPVDFLVYEGTSPSIGGLSLWSGDLKEPQKLLDALRADTPAANMIRNGLPEDLRTRISALPKEQSPDDLLLEAIADGLNALIEGPPLHDQQVLSSLSIKESDSKALASFFQMPADQAAEPQNRQEISRLNRCVIEAIFPTQVARSGVVSRGSADRSLPLAPGSYWLVAESDPQLRVRQQVEAGQSLSAVAAAEGAVWFRFARWNQKEPAKWRLLRLRDQAAMQRALVNFRLPARNDEDFWIRRPGVASADIAHALKLAREALPLAILPPDRSNTPGDQLIMAWAEDELRRRSVMRIVQAVGDETDVQRIIALTREHLDQMARYQVGTMLRTAAAVESRRGNLDRGELRKLLQDPQETLRWSAAGALAHRGVSDAAVRAQLHQQIKQDMAHLPGEAAMLLLRQGLDETDLAAMRDLLRRCMAAAENNKFDFRDESTVQASYGPVLALLAYGGIDDWRMVSERTLGMEHAALLAAFAEDPLQPLGELIDRGMYPTAIDAAQVFRDRSDRERAGLFRVLAGAIAGHAASKKSHWQDQRAESFQLYRQTHVVGSWHTPSAMSAEIARKNTFELHRDSIVNHRAWWPVPQPQNVIKLWSQGHLAHMGQLDHLEPRELEQVMAQHAPSASLPQKDLVLAAHRIGSQSWWTDRWHFPLGADHRAYVLSYIEHDSSGKPEYGGGVSGVASLMVQRQADQLQLWLRLDQHSYYHDIGTLAGIIDRQQNLSEWAHHRFMLDHGLDMVEAVTLRRGDQVIQARDTGRTIDGWLIFTAPAASGDPAELFADIHLKFVEKPLLLSFPLHAGENGYALRSSFDPAPPAAAQGLEGARALMARGDLDGAMTAYAKALATSDSIDTWYEVSDVLAQRFEHRRATQWLTQAIQAHPEEADLHRERARQMFLAEQYQEAADVIAATPPAILDDGLRYIRAVCLTLLDRGDEARALLGRLDARFAPDRVAVLRCVLTLKSDAQRDTWEQSRALVDQRKEDPAMADLAVLVGAVRPEEALARAADEQERCRLHFAAGVNLLSRGNTAAAIASFQNAVGRRTPELLEHRLAQWQLRRLEPNGSATP